MKYTADEVIQFVEEENVKFIRLAFCDIYGRQKNISIMPGELRRAFSDGMAFDASAIAGFGGAVRSDLFLRPDPSTLTGLPWRPENGRDHFFTSSRRQLLLRERQNTGRVFLRKWRGIDEFPDFFRITLKHRCAFAVTLPPQQVINRTTATTFSPGMKFNYHPAPPVP